MLKLKRTEELFKFPEWWQQLPDMQKHALFPSVYQILQDRYNQLWEKIDKLQEIYNCKGDCLSQGAIEAMGRQSADETQAFLLSDEFPAVLAQYAPAQMQGLMGAVIWHTALPGPIKPVPAESSADGQISFQIIVKNNCPVEFTPETPEGKWLLDNYRTRTPEVSQAIRDIERKGQHQLDMAGGTVLPYAGSHMLQGVEGIYLLDRYTDNPFFRACYLASCWHLVKDPDNEYLSYLRNDGNTRFTVFYKPVPYDYKAEIRRMI